MSPNPGAKSCQYIELGREMYLRDFPGRYTNLINGAYGFLLSVEAIENLANASTDTKERMLKELEHANNQGLYYALIAGYPILLNKSDFSYLKTIPHHVAGYLI